MRQKYTPNNADNAHLWI